MDKYELIAKLVQAADIVHDVAVELAKITDDEFTDELNLIYDDIADIADQIEEHNQE